MPVERFFVDEPLDEKNLHVLREQEFHHLKHVVRMREGEELELVDGRGYLASATIERLNRDHAVVSINKIGKEDKPPFEVILAQAIPRGNHPLSWILEKATELGVSQFWFFPSTHSQRKLPSEHQLERMRATTIAAMKQCGRLYLPDIVLKPFLSDWEFLEESSFFGDVRPTASPFAKALETMHGAKRIVFFVGPESGFTSEEVVQLEKRGVKGVKLNRNILRVETAAVVALSVIESRLTLE